MSRRYCAHVGDGRTVCLACGEPYDPDVRTRGARIAARFERAIAPIAAIGTLVGTLVLEIMGLTIVIWICGVAMGLW